MSMPRPKFDQLLDMPNKRKDKGKWKRVQSLIVLGQLFMGSSDIESHLSYCVVSRFIVIEGKDNPQLV